jgi:hypothetical protein
MKFATWIASLMLLGGAAAERLSLRPAADAAPYHARVRQVAQGLAKDRTGWSVSDVPVPYDALQMLQPNVLISRCYVGHGRRVWFLLIQCQDVRALEDHYPPHCYVAIGYTRLAAHPRDWRPAGMAVSGMEYQFARAALDPATAIVVENFMVLPDVGIVRDMEPVTRAAADVRRRNYGAAEFQILFEPGTPADERSSIVEEILAPYVPVIDSIRSRPN